MRPVRPALGIVVLLFALAACSSGDPTWTYAPPPSETPVPSTAPSGEPASPAPSGQASAAPSAQASAPPSAGPSAAPSGGASAAPSGAAALVQVSAVNIEFEQDSLTVPADTPLAIEFANNDAGVPHNVAIRDSGGTELFVGDLFNGVETRTYDAPALAAGAYTWICSVHPNMVIDVTAE